MHKVTVRFHHDGGFTNVDVDGKEQIMFLPPVDIEPLVGQSLSWVGGAWGFLLHQLQTRGDTSEYRLPNGLGSELTIEVADGDPIMDVIDIGNRLYLACYAANQPVAVAIAQELRDKGYADVSWATNPTSV